MRAVFHHKDHSIVFERTLSGAILFIDNKECDRIKDGMRAQLMKCKLNGEAVNEDGSRDAVCLELVPGFLMDTLTLYYNGTEIENKQIRG